MAECPFCADAMDALVAEIERLREAGDALYEATCNSWNAGYLEEATDARDRWRSMRHIDGSNAL